MVNWSFLPLLVRSRQTCQARNLHATRCRHALKPPASTAVRSNLNFISNLAFIAFVNDPSGWEQKLYWNVEQFTWSYCRTEFFFLRYLYLSKFVSNIFENVCRNAYNIYMCSEIVIYIKIKAANEFKSHYALFLCHYQC